MECNRGPDGRFLKGKPGISPGRPKETEEYAKWRGVAIKRMPKILQVLLDKCEAGDMTAIKILFERVWPAFSAELIEMRNEIDALHAEELGLNDPDPKPPQRLEIVK